MIFGLSSREAAIRLAQFGPNEIQREKKSIPFSFFSHSSVVFLNGC